MELNSRYVIKIWSLQREMAIYTFYNPKIRINFKPTLVVLRRIFLNFKKQS